MDQELFNAHMALYEQFKAEWNMRCEAQRLNDERIIANIAADVERLCNDIINAAQDEHEEQQRVESSSNLH
jgi:hypothetical protein